MLKRPNRGLIFFRGGSDRQPEQYRSPYRSRGEGRLTIPGAICSVTEAGCDDVGGRPAHAGLVSSHGVTHTAWNLMSCRSWFGPMSGLPCRQRRRRGNLHCALGDEWGGEMLVPEAGSTDVDGRDRHRARPRRPGSTYRPPTKWSYPEPRRRGVTHPANGWSS